MTRKVVIRPVLRTAVTVIEGLYLANGVELAECRAHGGRLTLADLGRVGANTPAVLVAVLRLSQVRRPAAQGVVYRLQWAAYPIACETADTSADEGAAELAETLVEALPGQTWGRRDCVAVNHTDIDATNLYSGEVAQRGVALWGVTWEQEINTDPRRLP